MKLKVKYEATRTMLAHYESIKLIIMTKIFTYFTIIWKNLVAYNWINELIKGAMHLPVYDIYWERIKN